jgi:hypothetical protein
MGNFKKPLTGFCSGKMDRLPLGCNVPVPNGGELGQELGGPAGFGGSAACGFSRSCYAGAGGNANQQSE